MKQTKQDLQFMIQLDRANRDSVLTMGMFMLTATLSITAFVISVFSVAYAIAGFSLYTLVLLVVFILVLAPIWYTNTKNATKAFEDSKKLNLTSKGFHQFFSCNSVQFFPNNWYLIQHPHDPFILECRADLVSVDLFHDKRNRKHNCWPDFL